MPSYRCVLAFLAVLASPAAADDETSEHTMQLLGATADTVGVMANYDEANGWSLTVRAKPGADPVTFKPALPTIHAHYIAYVTPGRGSIAIVEVSAGRAPTAKDTIAWVYLPDGRLLRNWTFGAVVDAKELADSLSSTSHHSVLRDFQQTTAGLGWLTRKGGRAVLLAADGTTFR